MDGFDSKKTIVPYFKNAPKNVDSCARYCMKITTYLYHGHGSLIYYHDDTVEVSYNDRIFLIH